MTCHILRDRLLMISFQIPSLHYNNEHFDHIVFIILALGFHLFRVKNIRNPIFIMPIHPSDQQLFGFPWQGQDYIDECLPISCILFQTFLYAFQHAFLSFFFTSVWFIYHWWFYFYWLIELKLEWFITLFVPWHCMFHSHSDQGLKAVHHMTVLISYSCGWSGYSCYAISFDKKNCDSQ